MFFVCFSAVLDYIFGTQQLLYYLLRIILDLFSVISTTCVNANIYLNLIYQSNPIYGVQNNSKDSHEIFEIVKRKLLNLHFDIPNLNISLGVYVFLFIFLRFTLN